MRFEFATAGRIVFGAGAIRDLAALADGMGQCALVVTGRNPGRATILLDLLKPHGLGAVLLSVPGEPTIDIVRAGRDRARTEGCDFVIGFGGGSPIDAAKAIAILMTHPGDPLDYLEVVGRGQPLTRASAPCVAIPTTAGTGAEVTRNSVLASPEHQVKASLRSPLLLPRLALVDPELTYSLPKPETAFTGLDALTQLIEPFVSPRSNPMTDAICREGLARVARSLRRAYEEGRDPQAREDMALAGLLGGLALANAGLGAVHGLAAPLGGGFQVPHGAVCAILLAKVMQMNFRALRRRAPDHPALERYRELAGVLTGRPEATAEQGIAWVQQLSRGLNLPGLSQFGVDSSAVPALAEKSLLASSMRANPIPLTREELVEVLMQSL